MCGRYTLRTPKEDIARQFGVEIDDELEPRYNIAPAQTVTAVRVARGGEGREFVYLNWGLIPNWAEDSRMASKLINARGETLTEKPSFRKAFRRKPCLVVADGFFEWDKKGRTKHPYYFRLKDGRPFAFAGLWERWASQDGKNVETCAIITTTPNELLARIHDRMPGVLAPEECDVWLDVDTRSADARKELLRPFPSSEMIAYPVGTQVNSPQIQGPDLIRRQGRIPLKRFMSVLEYIEETNPPEVRELLTAAHHFLRETLPPFATCAIKWRVPFYSLRRNFCYLNRHRDHITLGFPHGHRLAPQPGVLLGESEKLKQVRYLEIRSVEDLYSEETLRILHEAILLDETMAKVKPGFRRKNRRPF